MVSGRFFFINNVRFERFGFFGPIFSTVTMFKASNIRHQAIINLIFFKHFGVFVVEVTDDLRNYLFLDRRFAKIICSSMDVFRNCFILQRVIVGIYFFFDRQFVGIF